MTPVNGTPPDLSTPAKRNAWCAEHGLPGWLLFHSTELLAVNVMQAKMKAEIEKFRALGKRFAGTAHPEGVLEAWIKKESRTDAYRAALMDILTNPLWSPEHVRLRVQEGLNA